MDSTRKRVIIEMADLTHGVEQPCLMDIKMATRTFTEEDAASQEPRAPTLLTLTLTRALILTLTLTRLAGAA